MIPFLKSIAKAYCGRYPDLSEICFLFPNKRSGTFFLKYLKEESRGHVMMSPEIITVTDLVGKLSGKVLASRLDQLFRLFRCYLEETGLRQAMTRDDGGIMFEEFAGWGETVLSDFNEVDLYLAEAPEVFKNVKDFREISSTFLTAEQRKVMEEYFGHSDGGDPSRFWRTFDNADDMSEVKKRFLHLWRIMWPLYCRFNESLSKEGLSTNGGMYRRACARLEKEGRSALQCKKIVAVGFNALSTSEHTIFRLLRDEEGYEGYDAFADFFWDATGPVLGQPDNSASRFVKSNIKHFPCPDWALPSLQLSFTDELPRQIRVAASPSNAAQAKITGILLSELKEKVSEEVFSEAKAAVVLSDENLLLPMLYSMPDKMGSVNLTMGYPMRMTSVVSFVSLLRKVCAGIRERGGEKVVMTRELKAWLSHPFSHACFSVKAVNDVCEAIGKGHKISISLGDINTVAPEIASTFSLWHRDCPPLEALGWLDGILCRIAELLPAQHEALLKSRLETSHIQVYRDALHRLSDIFSCHGIQMTATTAFRMADRLIAGETIGFEGEPLSGLQVMGLLETRSLDFEHLYIISANERVLPQRMRSRSFIPDSLRKAYGMPPSNYAEEIFAYYFYRMISRAKDVTLVYDARCGSGMRSGDISRYILQLRYLFAPGKLIEEDWKFRLSGKRESDPSVVKTTEIMNMLEAFSKEGGKNLSASSLQAYRECQVKFFYQSVLGLSSDPEPTGFVDAITAGNVLHDVMNRIYTKGHDTEAGLFTPPVIFTDESIAAFESDREGIERLIRSSINRLHFHKPEEKSDEPLSGAAEMVATRIYEQVMRILAHDRRRAPFAMVGCEAKGILRVDAGDGRRVNFKYAVDRIDESETNGKRILRIVDYKTGSIKLELPSFEDIFSGNWEGEQVFQLFTYAWILGQTEAFKGKRDIMMEIYNVPAIHKGGRHFPKIGRVSGADPDDAKPEEVHDFSEYADRFSEGMQSMIRSIFEAPRFEACKEEGCRHCTFKPLCHR